MLEYLQAAQSNLASTWLTNGTPESKHGPARATVTPRDDSINIVKARFQK